MNASSFSSCSTQTVLKRNQNSDERERPMDIIGHKQHRVFRYIFFGIHDLPSVWVGVIKSVVPILGILFLLLTVNLKAIQIQGDSLDRRGFGCSEGLDH